MARKAREEISRLDSGRRSEKNLNEIQNGKGEKRVAFSLNLEKICSELGSRREVSLSENQI